MPMFNPLKFQNASVMHSFYPAPVKRHQSFHGFQNKDAIRFSAIQNHFLQAPAVPNSFRQQLSMNFLPSTYNLATTGPSVFHNPSLFSYNCQLNRTPQTNPFSPYSPANTITSTPRVVGRKESQISLGNHEPQLFSPSTNVSQPSTSRKQKPVCKSTTTAEKRFGSLELKKHRCYSPTFYSLRCKKHAKKRPIIYAIPKKHKSQPTLNTNHCNFQTLTDSIQISEQNLSNSFHEHDDIPKPAPRCRKAKSEIVYQNFSPHSHNITNSNVEDAKTLDSSNDGSENCDHHISTTEVLVHKSNLDNTNSRSAGVTPKSGTKDSPTVMVKPSFIKPKMESPKGALSLQIQAKLKSPSYNEPPSIPSDENKEVNADCVPKMPILDMQNKWSTNKLNANQVCPFFVASPVVVRAWYQLVINT